MTTRAPDRNTWRDLMRPALRIIDSLKTNGYGELEFRLGGGTVLMFRFDHRVSKDIDLFIDDAQALSFMTPRLNDVVLGQVNAYREQANSIKLVLDAGDIDIIVSGTVIPNASAETLDFEGRGIKVDPVCEILAKKMLYRAASFKARDVFDMAAALALDPRAASQALKATRNVHAVLLRRLATLNRLGQDELLADIVLTDAGRIHTEDMVATLAAAISEDRHAAGSAKVTPVDATLTPSMKTIVNAVENASREPVTPAGIIAVLKGESAIPSHVRAVFGDVSFYTLEEAGAAAGIATATILASYGAARQTAGAANEEMDALLAQPW